MQHAVPQYVPSAPSWPPTQPCHQHHHGLQLNRAISTTMPPNSTVLSAQHATVHTTSASSTTCSTACCYSTHHERLQRLHQSMLQHIPRAHSVPSAHCAPSTTDYSTLQCMLSWPPTRSAPSTACHTRVHVPPSHTAPSTACYKMCHQRLQHTRTQCVALALVGRDVGVGKGRPAHLSNLVRIPSSTVHASNMHYNQASFLCLVVGRARIQKARTKTRLCWFVSQVWLPFNTGI